MKPFHLKSWGLLSPCQCSLHRVILLVALEVRGESIISAVYTSCMQWHVVCLRFHVSLSLLRWIRWFVCIYPRVVGDVKPWGFVIICSFNRVSLIIWSYLDLYLWLSAGDIDLPVASYQISEVRSLVDWTNKFIVAKNLLFYSN